MNFPFSKHFRDKLEKRKRSLNACRHCEWRIPMHWEIRSFSLAVV